MENNDFIVFHGVKNTEYFYSVSSIKGCKQENGYSIVEFTDGSNLIVQEPTHWILSCIANQIFRRDGSEVVHKRTDYMERGQRPRSDQGQSESNETIHDEKAGC